MTFARPFAFPDGPAGRPRTYPGYTVLAGVAVVAIFAAHGATYLTLRLSGDFCERAAAMGRRLSLPAALLGIAIVGWTVAVAHDRSTGRVTPGEPDDRSGKEDCGFNAKARDSIGGHDFPQQAVECEADAEREADPQLAQRARSKNRDTGSCDRDGRPLQPVELLLQHETAEEHVRQRVEVITKARRQDMPAGHRIDVEQPISADQQGGDYEHTHGAGPAQRVPDLGPSARDRDHNRKERDGPQHPMRDDVERRHALERLEVERQDAPQGVSQKPEHEAASMMVAGVSVRVHPAGRLAAVSRG